MLWVQPLEQRASAMLASGARLEAALGLLQDKSRMYTVGSLFYAIYFFVSFPVFFQMDERPQSKWTLGRAATDALASGMAVTILLDLWRLTIGGIASPSRASGLPWM